MSFLTKCCNPLKRICSRFPVTNFCTVPDYKNCLKLNGISLNNYIEKLQKEFEVLNKENINNSRKLELQPIMQIVNERNHLINNIHNLKELLEEKGDLRELAVDEKSNYEKQLESLDKKLLHSLVPTDKNDLYDTLVLEVQAGVGGQEAMLFAKEIFEMYKNFIEYKGT